MGLPAGYMSYDVALGRISLIYGDRPRTCESHTEVKANPSRND